MLPPRRLDVPIVGDLAYAPGINLLCGLAYDVGRRHTGDIARAFVEGGIDRFAVPIDL